jgi:CubicO group peptidase (beta-lactamase class C family)
VALALAVVAAPGASEDVIEAMLADRLAGRDHAGIVVGIIDADGLKLISKGRVGEGAAAVPGADTIFEVGGITDPFVGLLLSDMVHRGEVALSDPVAKYLPEIAVPMRGGKAITLEDLAMHRSGLPRAPANLPRGSDNPYAEYTRQMLADFLQSYELPRDIGERYEPSPLGTGLLGEALATKAGQPIDQLLETRVIGPLGLPSTTARGDGLDRARLATGYSPGGKPLPPARFRVLAAAGALRSTANDLMKFLTLNSKPSGPLAAAMADTHSAHGKAGAVHDNLGLGWRMRGKGDQQVLWSGGRSGGFYAFIGFEPATGRGVVVLHNQAVTMDDVGFAVLDQLREEATPVDVGALAAFVGEYEINRKRHVRVTFEGRKLVAEITGEEPSPLTQDSELRFVFDESDARLTFVRDPNGAIIGLWLHRGSSNTAARRVK